MGDKTRQVDTNLPMILMRKNLTNGNILNETYLGLAGGEATVNTASEDDLMPFVL